MATATEDMDAEHAASLGRRYLIRFEEDTLRSRPLWIRLVIEFVGTLVLVTLKAHHRTPDGGRKTITLDMGQLPAGPAVPAGLGWHPAADDLAAAHAYLGGPCSTISSGRCSACLSTNTLVRMRSAQARFATLSISGRADGSAGVLRCAGRRAC
jgi:hypothetical protein